MERFDGHAPLRNALRQIAEGLGHWSGVPMPLEDETLVVEPTYPNAEALMRMAGGRKDEPEDEGEMAGAKVRNSFWSSHKRSEILVIEKADGRVTWGIVPGVHHLKYDLRTLGCAEAWGIEQESKAVHLLGTLMSHRAFKQYLLTGMFLESSKRSGIVYLFRRLKPTLAINVGGTQSRVMCALCLHPIAYYAGSWAGAMTPSDDVAAHLMLMRGDEPMFWRRSNQHPAWRPEAGL